MRHKLRYAAMYKPLTFGDEYSRTYLSAFETLFFCATNNFTIPHDVVGAILYAEVLACAEDMSFGAFVPDGDSLKYDFVPEGDSYFNAIKFMGYQDIIDVFNRHSQEISAFIKERFAACPYKIDEVVKKIESLVPPEYMAIIMKYQNTKHEIIEELPLVIGLSENKTYKSIDLLKAKNILVAGAPGQGKSKLLESMRNSLSRNLTEVYYVNLDQEINPECEAMLKIDYVHTELQSRNNMFLQSGVRNIQEYNLLNLNDRLPHIVVIVNEYTVLQDCSDIMKNILFLAKNGHKAGVHLIISTSNPYVDLISNKIKMVFPTRIAFKTRNRVDSRTILDVSGAEKLSGYGDMLLLYNDELVQLKCDFVE